MCEKPSEFVGSNLNLAGWTKKLTGKHGRLGHARRGFLEIVQDE
jgi:hypothetical protein